MRRRLAEVPGSGSPRRAGGGREQPAAGWLGAVARGWRRTAPGEQVRTLTVRGRVLRVAVRGGNPQWPPLVLCNGIGARLELLQPFVDAVDPQREVVRFDMPGIGGSPEPVMPYHLWTLAPLLSGLLDQLGYQQADVLGISWGGGLAQQFALRDPARVRRLVLVSTATGALMVPGHPRVLRHMLTPRRHRDPAHAAAIAGEIYGGSMRDGASRISELLARNGKPRTGPGLLLPASGRRRVDKPAAAAAGTPAHPDTRGRRRPPHPPGQRADHAPADPPQRTAYLPRRAPCPRLRARTHGGDRGGLPHRRDRGRCQERGRPAGHPPRQAKATP